MSPSGGEGFPTGGVLVLSPNDDGGPPSAGHFPPNSWRDPSRQHQTLVEAKKIDTFLGMDMLHRIPKHQKGEMVRKIATLGYYCDFSN